MKHTSEEYEEVIAYEREERARLDRYLRKLCEAAGVTPDDREPPLSYTARARRAILDLKANNAVSDARCGHSL